MNAIPPPAPATPTRTLCLGAARVDLVCERQVMDLSQADLFVPHFGGAVACVAVTAARAGARITLAGVAGDDVWGRWARDRLAGEGVETSLFELMAGSQTQVALVTVDPEAVPSGRIYGTAPGSVATVLGERVEAVVDESAAVFVSGTTLVDEDEREVSMRVRELALAAEKPVIFDPGLRPYQWRTRAHAAATVNACVPGALLVRADAADAALMTGEDDPERAAQSLVKAGAQMVVIGLGAKGAILRGKLRADAPGALGAAVCTLGSGETLTGVLLARLATSGFYPAAVAASLRDAVGAAARACERWGALD